MLSLSTLAKAAKRCAFNPSESNNDFLNHLLEPYVQAGKVTARGGADFRLDKHRTSKILSGQADVPVALRKVRLQHGLEKRVAAECDILWDETLNPLYFENLKEDVLSLVDESDSLQRALKEKLVLNSNDRSLFMACALVGVIGLSNKPEVEGLLWKKGTGSFGWTAGDLFHFGFGAPKKKKSLVVIPVDCSFETHVTRAYEGVRAKRVSENTVHGKWLIRMAQTGMLEAELKERLSCELENQPVDERGCYPIGTIATIETNRSVFLLLSISRFDANGNAQSSPREIADALDALLRYYDRCGQGSDLYLPLLGTGLSRSGLNSREAFSLIVDAVTEGASFIGGKVMVVLLPDVAKDLSLIG